MFYYFFFVALLGGIFGLVFGCFFRKVCANYEIIVENEKLQNENKILKTKNETLLKLMKDFGIDLKIDINNLHIDKRI
jgi:hypothetical protein